MDLREAIKLAENCPDGCSDEWSLILPILETLSAAAKRELEREERGRPVPSKVDRVATWAASPRLKDLLMRESPSLGVGVDEAAEITKALRNVVVPELKKCLDASRRETPLKDEEILVYRLLRSLGEAS